MDPFAGDWGFDPVLEPEVNLDLEGLEELGLFGIKLPKIKIGLPKITIRNKWVKRAMIGAAGIISGGTLPYLARQGAIPGIRLGKEDKKLVNEFYRNAAIATGAAAAVAAAPVVLPAVGSAVGTAASAAGGMALKAGSALVKGTKATGIDKAIAEGLKKGWKQGRETTKVRKGNKGIQTLNIRPPEPTARKQTNWIPWVIAGLVLYLWSKQ